MFRVSLTASKASDDKDDIENDWFYLSLDESLFDLYFVFSIRLTPTKDDQISFGLDLHDEFLQKKVHFKYTKSQKDFESIFEKVVKLYSETVNNRLEANQVFCPVVHMANSSDSEPIIKVWLCYDLPLDHRIGK